MFEDAPRIRIHSAARARAIRRATSRSTQRSTGLAIALAAALAAVACSTNAPHYRDSIDGETLDIAVRYWRTEGIAPDYRGPTDFGRILAEYIAGSLQPDGYRAVAVPRDAPLPAGTRYVFDGSIQTLDPGSWSLRFWIGFGAGHSLVNASGTLTEVATGKAVLVDSQRARSNTWQGQENILRRTCARVARAFAADIKKALPP
jgi:hypothetical protein